MVSVDEGALICDFAETYGIYDYRSLPLRTTATLASGLRDDARIKTKIRGGKAETDTDVLIGMVYDRLVDVLRFLGAYKKPPESLALRLAGIPEGKVKEGTNIRSYSSGDDFEKARNRILQKGS